MRRNWNDGFFDCAGVLHVHSLYSPDSGATLADVLAGARWGRADFVLIADHDDFRAKEWEGWWLVGEKRAVRLEGKREEVGLTPIPRGGSAPTRPSPFSDIPASVGRVDDWPCLVLAGQEVTCSGGGHLLAMGIDSEVAGRTGGCQPSPQEAIDRVRLRGGLAFIEHPFFDGNPSLKIPASRWGDWGVNGFSGLSIFNFTSDWGGRLDPWRYVLYAVAPGLAIDAPNPETLRKWDELAASFAHSCVDLPADGPANGPARVPFELGKTAVRGDISGIVGIGTVDAHLCRFRMAGVMMHVHPFHYFFHSIRTHVLLDNPLHGDFKSDASALYGAIGRGRCYVSNDYLSDADGFSFIATRHMCQGEVQGGVRLLATIGSAHHIRLVLYRNGVPVSQTPALEARRGKLRTYSWTACEPGAYRLEVWIRKHGRYKPWIFSNPVVISAAHYAPR